MSLKRRHFLMFLGASAGTAAIGGFGSPQNGESVLPFQTGSAVAAPASSDAFPILKGAMPLDYLGLSPEQQIAEYSSFAVADDVVVPAGYTYDVIGAWGDPLGDSRFGYNNDYLSFVETAPGEGFLTINFEYISGATWAQTYEPVIGQSLPFAEVMAATEANEGGINAFALPNGDPLKAQIEAVSKEALVDIGLGVVSIRQEADGRWVRTYSEQDRRITGVSGLEDGRYLGSTGPSVSVFRKTSGQGYIDDLGDRIIGTVNNCAGGTSPWGTVFSAEENFQNFVPEGVYSDGTSMDPSAKTFEFTDEIDGPSNVFGLAGNKYGWMVEVDPADATDFGTKHTWLGRFRHEAVAIRAVPNRKLAVYSGCDRRGGHVYKFASTATVTNPQDKANSRLLEDGMLYAAKFNTDGTGYWIPLEASTPVNPDMPSVHAGGMITLPVRPDGGFTQVEDDAEAMAFAQRFSTLGDLYEGSPEEKQGAILIDVHYAANAAGATCTARPEDTDLNASGSLFIAFTSGSPSSSDGSPDARIFQGPNGESPYEHGWIMRLDEDGNDPGAMTFTWEMFGLGGEPAEGGLGFSNPDNLEFDASGNLWMVTDISTSRHNFEVSSRIDENGEPVSQSQMRGLFGNNSIWVMPTTGPNAGEAYLFGFGPMECEMCGPFVTNDQRTLFAAAQHPGELNGTRMDMGAEMRQYAMKTTNGQDFMQSREVPIGSNWPTKGVNDPPKPAVVAIRRLDGETLI